MPNSRRTQIPILLSLWLIASLTLACVLTTPLQGDAETSGEDLPTPTPEPIRVAEIFFWVEIPPLPSPKETLQLVILDEVTGLPYNQDRIDMSPVDATHYGASIQVPIGSVIKYRYERSKDGFFQEYLTSGEPVRYRLYYVEGPGEVHDLVSRWQESPAPSQLGRIVGNVFDENTGRPVSNVLLTAGGTWALTATDGSFIINQLPAGNHNLVAYSLDGSFLPRQQQATVAANSATPAAFPLQRTQMVDVTFVVTVPEETSGGIPIRLAGNLIQLGNTFSDLGSGISGFAPNMPVLSPIDQNRYSITVKLPKGIDIRYKFTFGDGVTNAEHTRNGSFNTHSLLIPKDSQPILIQDTVESWQMAKVDPIWFDVTVPADTPDTDQIFIQVKLSGWLAPLPMWKVGDNRWVYQIAGPAFSNKLEYRYCRNGQCTPYNQFGAELIEEPRSVKFSRRKPVLIKDEVVTWNHYLPGSPSATVLSNPVQPKSGGFIAGVSFSADYAPTMDYSRFQTLERVKELNANLIVLQPSWTAVSQSSHVLIDQVIGINPQVAGIASQVNYAHQEGLQVALFPQIIFPFQSRAWWQGAPVNDIWWRVWFERYRVFVLQYADLAEATGVETLVLGGEWLTPAIPNSSAPGYPILPLPGSIVSIWEDLIAEVRRHYSGEIAWYMPLNQIDRPPPFLDTVDTIYLSWGAKLANSPQFTVTELQRQAESLLTKQVKPFKESIGKPIILNIAYPSVNTGATNCLPYSASNTECLPVEFLSPLFPDPTHIILDLDEQVDVYNAILAAVNEKNIVQGVISEGFIPAIGLEDKSISIHGKPAQTVISYWFAQFLGK